MKKAFTMLELIFIIVVIGILAVAVISRDGSNTLREAAVQLVSHIRYTQHLAMVDDKFSSTDSNWYKQRWQIIFNTTTGITYSIYSDKTAFDGDAHLNEVAIDPMSKDKVLSGGSSNISLTDASVNKELNLGSSYGITNLSLNDGCSGSRISFDNMGRPLQGAIHNSSESYVTANMIQATCNIILTGSDGLTVTIAIEPETGYARIL